MRALAWSKPLATVSLTAVPFAYLVGAAAGIVSWLGFVALAVIMAAAIPWTARVGTSIGPVDYTGLLRISLALKLIATLPRYQTRVDSRVYQDVGTRLAAEFRSFDFFVDTGRSIPGTGTVRYASGLVQLITFDDPFATFLVFSIAGFVGIVWFVRAFAVSYPGLDPLRYGVLVLFWPSLLYWPSSLGKEAMMLFGLGASALGFAFVLAHQRRGLVWLGLGLSLTVLVRPHVGLIVVTAGMCALVVRQAKGRAAGLGLLVVSALVVVGSIAADGIERLLAIDGLNPTSLTTALDLAESRSAQGGSSFDSARIDNIFEFPWGLVTVLFRPFPWEAASASMLITSLEAALLAGVTIASVPRLAAAVRHVRTEAYGVYASVFVIVFVYLFSALSNFGILARQRTTALPLLLVLLALPSAQMRVRALRGQPR